MEKLSTDEIRSRFLGFFQEKGHLLAPSASLIPQNDKGLLIINAGMAPLKPYFTGITTPPSKRMVTCQKCVRTGDVENVGVTSRHVTFFEMLGNFSFGDYFKTDAIKWAWEFMTRELGFDENRLFVSVYLDDNEAYDIWHNVVGLPETKIFKLGKEDNFWELSLGPCGPSSEIYFDRGERYGCGKDTCTVGCDCDRFVEVWNLVFTQFNKHDDGTYTELKQKNIDTGMGLERLAVMMQDVPTIFDIDTFVTIRDKVCEKAGYTYNSNDKKDLSIRIISDHIRSVTFMMCDGILPSNEGRGYVLRRLLRRAAIRGKLLGISDTFLSELATTVIGVFGGAYPELEEKRDYIYKLLSVEEKRFHDTLDAGMEILDKLSAGIKDGGGLVLRGIEAFKLYDTYGFPVELTQEILSERGFSIDADAFAREMEKQRERARSARETTNFLGGNDNVYLKLNKDLKTEFVGYETLTVNGARVLAIISGDEIVTTASSPENVAVVLDKTPMYAESGGQKGDIGEIRTETGVIRVDVCVKVNGDKTVHIGEIKEGFVSSGQPADASVDARHRDDTAKNHTATHLLHKALKDVLGAHVEQAGSLVGDDALRFDFTHFAPVTKDDIINIENIVFDRIMDGLAVTVGEMPIDDARKKGATALFGEKYGDIVRVVDIGGYSIELCGGTHVRNTAQIGLFKILSERGVAAGVRRIEALTGMRALEYYRSRENIIDEAAAFLKAPHETLMKKIEYNMTQFKELSRELEKLKNSLSGNALDGYLAGKVNIKGVSCVVATIDNIDINGLKTTGDALKEKMGSGVIILAGGKDGKHAIVVMATDDVVKKGVDAGKIIRAAAAASGGNGGGKPTMAQAGVKDASKIKEALRAATDMIGELL